MAFRTLPLLLFLNLLTDNVPAAMSVREKCECVKEINALRWRGITGFEVKKQEVLCNKVQIIMKMGEKSLCLNPSSAQGQNLLKCWKRVRFNEKKKDICFKPRQTKPKKKRKQKKQ
ncbi:chemokine (C-X-C motif) ligand 18a, duplicate 1 [Salminus brasiliensis]|uniref:chemokine (C-X-C motif) ligand 18a, duplicate 1 n=1 Tax=Salminus brasiliensis TaxID=930266 RepID=UPI003B83A33C